MPPILIFHFYVPHYFLLSIAEISSFTMRNLLTETIILA